MNLSRSMCLADNDGYVNYVHRYNDGRGKAPPNAQDTKKLFFFPRRECHWRAIKLERFFTYYRDLRKHTNLKDKKRIHQHLRLLTSCTLWATHTKKKSHLVFLPDLNYVSRLLLQFIEYLYFWLDPDLRDSTLRFFSLFFSMVTRRGWDFSCTAQPLL